MFTLRLTCGWVGEPYNGFCGSLTESVPSMARRRSGRYTVGLPRPGPNAAEIVRRWQRVVLEHHAEMAANYDRAIVAVASSPAALNAMQEKLAAWLAAFFGAGVPIAYRQAITRAKEQYVRTRYARIPVPAAPVAPAPAPA